MALYRWPDCPAEVREQVDELCAALSAALAEQLVGVYLHGSLAMGCFNPQRSDLDLLAITTDRMALATKRRIAEFLLACSLRPQPIEISFLAQAQLAPWRHPTPFDLHYSEAWRVRYTKDLEAGTWQRWNDSEQRDPDLAAHVTVAYQRGICLAGAPIAGVFPSVPDQDYRASITADIQDSLASIAANPVYTILNCCRTLAYIREGHVLSKEEGGRWGKQALPGEFHGLVATALEAYRSDAGDPGFDPGALDTFAAYMRRVLLEMSVASSQ